MATKEKLSHSTDIFRRNNQAPELNGTLNRNRIQFMVEKYIQNFNVPLQTYIDNHQYLVLQLPLEFIRDCYPGPNWKKDVKVLCDQMMQRSVTVQKIDGDFENVHLVSYCALKPEGLIWHLHPEALKYYRIGSDVRTTNLDYSASVFFRTKYSHQFYWELSRHANFICHFQLSLTPDDINRVFGVHYTASKIVTKILLPVQKEFDELYQQGILRFTFSIEEVRLLRGRAKYISEWKIGIQMQNQHQLGSDDIRRKDWIREVDLILQEYLPYKRSVILPQVARLTDDRLSRLYTRLFQLHSGELKGIKKPANYICQILLSKDYGINPNQLPPLDEAVVQGDPAIPPDRTSCESTGDDALCRWNRFQECSRQVLLSDYYEQGKHSGNTWEVWIKTLNFVSFRSGRLTVRASRIQAVFIEEKLIMRLEPVLKECFGNDVQLIYEIE